MPVWHFGCDRQSERAHKQPWCAMCTGTSRSLRVTAHCIAHCIQEHHHMHVNSFGKPNATNVTRWQGLHLGQGMTQASNRQVTPLIDTFSTAAPPATALPFGFRTGLRRQSLPHHPCNLTFHHLHCISNCTHILTSQFQMSHP